jgi:hypothetical protein
MALARESGNEATARLLANVVDVVDAASGTVRLKPTATDADQMALDTRVHQDRPHQEVTQPDS